MLIKKLIRKFKKREVFHYDLVEYTTPSGCGVVSLVREIELGLYKDIVNNRLVDERQITFHKNLNDYVKNGNLLLNDSKAKELAESFYDVFHKECSEFYVKTNKEKKDNTENPSVYCIV